MELQRNPNLTNTSTISAPSFDYKDILLRKLSKAVFYSVLSQLFILIIYIFIANIDILHPIEWVKSALNTFTYVSTWIFVIIFTCIIFLQCIICAKDYVFMATYCSTRFQQVVHIFSAHNFILLVLHSLIGGVLVWQILSVVDGSYRYLIRKIDEKNHLIVDSFYLIIGGFFTGFYFFLRVHVTSKNLVFPVTQQKKFLHFRSNIMRIIHESFSNSIWPTVYYAIFYYFWGHQMENRIISLFGLERYASQSSFNIYIYSWWFATLYFFSMNLMRFLFYLFLTETVEFPLVKYSPDTITLQDTLTMNTIPIIQHLACLDLFLLSQWSAARRQVFFTLSQPGGHPHTWNTLVESILKLFSDYTDLLKKTMELPAVNADKFIPQENVITSPISGIGLQTPTSPKYQNLRNMSYYDDPDNFVQITQKPRIEINIDQFKKIVLEKIDKFVNFLKILLGINYFFGELPEVNIQKCLGNGHLIIWSSQGISELMAASLTEDQFGVVQKDLPVIITSLVQMKQQFDKLNKVPSLSRKVAMLDDFNYKMKNAVSSALKRSMNNICLNFGKYFNEFALNREVTMYLHSNVLLKQSR